MPKPVALLLVGNTFTHDARVLRAAHALRDRGLDPVVVAVMSTEVRRRREVKGGVPVLRLDPQSPIGAARRALARGRRLSPAGTGAGGAAPGVRTRGRAATRLYRTLRTLDYYRRATGVVRRERPALLHCNDYNTLWVGAA